MLVLSFINETENNPPEKLIEAMKRLDELSPSPRLARELFDASLVALKDNGMACYRFIPFLPLCLDLRYHPSNISNRVVLFYEKNTGFDASDRIQVARKIQEDRVGVYEVRRERGYKFFKDYKAISYHSRCDSLSEYFTGVFRLDHSKVIIIREDISQELSETQKTDL